MAELSSVIYSPIGRGIIFVALALLLLEIELSILSIRQRRTFDTISLIWGIFFFTCLLDIIYVPWFAGKDVASALGYSNSSDAILKHVAAEDRLESRIAISGQVLRVLPTDG